MTDISKTIEPKSDQLNADDLIGGKTVTIKITKTTVISGEQPVTLNYEGDNGKPYKPGKSMRRVLFHVWGKDSQAYVGRSLTLYCDEKVKFGGLEVGGIRISHMSNITSSVTMALTASKANKKPFTVEPLKTAVVDPAVKSAGDTESAKGVVAYTAWLATLTPEIKATIKQYHSNWTAVAKAVKPEEEIAI